MPVVCCANPATQSCATGLPGSLITQAKSENKEKSRWTGQRHGHPDDSF